MTTPKPGDRVRVEFEGTVVRVYDKAIEVEHDGHIYVSACTACAVIAPPLPPEPPVGTVVIDRDGDLWQHSDHRWSCFTEAARRVWPDLLREYGPVTLLVPGDTLGTS